MVTICLCLNLMHSELWLSSLNLTFSIFALSKAKTVVPPVKISRATRGNSEIRQHENEEQKKMMLLNIMHSHIQRQMFCHLIVRPYLLNSEAERDVLFALPLILSYKICASAYCIGTWC
uniref:Secreted protein n=1 Tax=Meloidogyne incognita TaxID=6306 RepID=A0A914MI29_MELIC